MTINTKQKHTVGYIRLSVSNKEASCSVENQKLIIERWAAQHEIVIDHFYTDENYSGSSFERPAFKQLLKDILEGTIERVVVKDWSYLSCKRQQK